MRIILASLLAAATVAAPLARAEVEITGAARVLDGDTLDIGPVRIRLHGADAPEARQFCAAAAGEWPCGTAAADRLQALTRGQDTTCVPVERDAYGRLVATCTADGRDLGATLVAEGLAWAFVRYSDVYASLEAEARATRAGVWQADTPPAWDWRDTAWTSASGSGSGSGSAPDGCPIKGNITRAGARIYHTPPSRDYARTQINESYGERWFCTEAEAQSAGWRAPR